MSKQRISLLVIAATWVISAASPHASSSTAEHVAARVIGGDIEASSSTADGSAQGAVDGDRFSVAPGSVWRGRNDAHAWWWQVRFQEPRKVGAILQINGDHSGILHNAARHYVWQWSDDETTWHDLKETETSHERRLFRIHRFDGAKQVLSLRLKVIECLGDLPALREVEFFSDPSANIDFPDWIVSVSTRESSRLPGNTQSFVDLARRCRGWENVPAHQIWIGDLDEEFVAAEPLPLCAFFTGNYQEWCQRTREPWRGVQEVLANRNLPMWGACGGAQAFAILEETGVDKSWDCPRCRDPRDPKLPIYSHIGHTGKAACGDYSKSVGERGNYKMRCIARDPVLQDVPEVFEIMESHVGQINHLPQGWIRIVTKGPGALTVNQCIRVMDRPIYAAQFHIEMAGTPENSQTIMNNFLSLAKQWGGYNPNGIPVPIPEPLLTEVGHSKEAAEE